jgi:hypothetical protein
MWSMISRPGERKMESAAAWAWRFEDSGEDLMYLV